MTVFRKIQRLSLTKNDLDIKSVSRVVVGDMLGTSTVAPGLSRPVHTKAGRAV